MTELRERRRAYLLGELAEGEAAQLEAEAFASAAAAEAMEVALSELIDAYVRGRLSAERRERFEQRFMPALGGRVIFARALADRADGAESPSLAARAVALLRRSRTRLVVAFAIVAAVVVASLLLRPEVPEARDRIQEVRLSPAAIHTAVSEVTELTVTRGTTYVRLALVLDLDERPEHCEVVVEGSERVVWRTEALAKGDVMEVDVPAKRLKPGDYEVNLRGSAELPLASYAFRVLPR